MFIEVTDGIVINTDLVTEVYIDDDRDGGVVRFTNDRELRIEGESNINALMTNLYVRKLSRTIIDRQARIAREMQEYSDKYHKNPETT